MNRIFTMFKLNLIILLRNKGFLVFLVLLPLCAILLLNLQMTDGYSQDNQTHYSIHELENGKRPPQTTGHRRMSIVVFDADQSWLSDYILEQLAKTGSFQVYRYRSQINSLKEAEQNAVDVVNHNPIGAVLYIPPQLEEHMDISYKEQAVYLLKASDDTRISLLEESLSSLLSRVSAWQSIADQKPGALQELAGRIAAAQPDKEHIIYFDAEETTRLTAEQENFKSNIGLSLSVLSIAFLFSGAFIGSLAVEEQNNLVFTRILLTDTPVISYLAVKLILSLMISLIQVVIAGAGILLFVTTQFGLPSAGYLLFNFGIGLLYNLLSMTACILIGNLISASYFAFTIWIVCSLLSGLFFPMDAVSDIWLRAAQLMPPFWVLKCSEMVMLGQNGAYTTFLLVMSGFIIIILSAGLLGLKIRKHG